MPTGARPEAAVAGGCIAAGTQRVAAPGPAAVALAVVMAAGGHAGVLALVAVVSAVVAVGSAGAAGALGLEQDGKAKCFVVPALCPLSSWRQEEWQDGRTPLRVLSHALSSCAS